MYKYEIYPQINLTETMPAEDSIIRRLIEENNKTIRNLNILLARDIGLSFEEKIEMLDEEKYKYNIHIVKKEYDDETGKFLEIVNVKLFDLGAAMKGD